MNRGFGMLGDELFMLTLDAHLVALDAQNRHRRSGTSVLADYKIGYAATAAPLVVKDKVIVGISGGDFPTRGFIDAYDPATGKRRLAVLHGPGSGRAGQRDMAGAPKCMARGGGGHVGDGQLRSGAEHCSTGAPAIPIR